MGGPGDLRLGRQDRRADRPAGASRVSRPSRLARRAMLRVMAAFRFACTPGCTNCCDEKGFVYITQRDLAAIAQFLRMRPAEFERKYVYRTKHLLRLRKPWGSECHFLRQGGCAIHPVKPVQCRAFPFWPELVGDRDKWQATAAYCPGIGTGPLVRIEAAHRIAADMRESYPELYEDVEADRSKAGGA